MSTKKYLGSIEFLIEESINSLVGNYSINFISKQHWNYSKQILSCIRWFQHLICKYAVIVFTYLVFLIGDSADPWAY